MAYSEEIVNSSSNHGACMDFVLAFDSETFLGPFLSLTCLFGSFPQTQFHPTNVL